MFKSPDNRLSASNSAVLASESFLVPVTLHSEARTSQGAFDGLRQAFDEVSGFVLQLASTAPERYIASKPIDSISFALSALIAPGMTTQWFANNSRSLAERCPEEIIEKSIPAPRNAATILNTPTECDPDILPISLQTINEFSRARCVCPRLGRLRTLC